MAQGALKALAPGEESEGAEHHKDLGWSSDKWPPHTTTEWGQVLSFSYNKPKATKLGQQHLSTLCKCFETLRPKRVRKHKALKCPVLGEARQPRERRGGGERGRGATSRTGLRALSREPVSTGGGSRGAPAHRPLRRAPVLAGGRRSWTAVDMERLVERLEKAVERLETVCQGPGMCGDGSSKGVAQYVQAFDALLAGPVAEYIKISKEVGGDVQKHAEMVHAGLMSERALLVMASQHQQPTENAFSSLLKPISEQIQVVQNFREKNRGSKLFNHLSAVSESIPALGWVAMAPKPGPYVKEMTDAAMFYTNRILKEYKDVDKKHVDWVKAYLSIWTELQAYIKEYHTTGLTWSKTGPVATEGTKSPSAPPAGAAPPPPGPPPPPAPAPTSSSTDDSASRSALFAQINRGEGITSGLRHVSDDMKTHKNPALKNQGGPVRSGPKPFTAPKPACNANPSQKTSPKAPALLELEGKKWRVENQENATNLVISDTELKQVAYVFKCTNSTLQIKGKINSITLDNCKKLGLVFDDVVGIVEIINSRDVKVQVMGKVPTISINKTDGCHVYLSKSSLDCEIVSAKSSEMNVLIPTEGGDFTEFPVPEQFKTVWNGQKLVTTVTEIAG
ncbi:PREDICTED: adenylyl cyclase-associated protein 1 [Calidris pugnax]|uniref:adenylyl cyclase-associated protein 1 n=1 Tax=Calidris pugnax TaxID=198806 RepID=UPI00071E187E|nr:PREDICTED: adenylyl cyclase-associated protein 1 [Calidris pugnax]